MTAPVMVTAKIDDILADGNPQRFTQDGYGSRIYCADGFHLSVIAGQGAYSTPRSELPRLPRLDPSWEPADYPGPYTHVEVGFPSARPEPWDDNPREDGWRSYCEDTDQPTETVYGYVPGGMVRDLILLHGGEKS